MRRSPPTIARAVIPILVWIPIDRHFVRSFAHVRQEILERRPPLAYLYAIWDIVLSSRFCSPSATVVHGLPNGISTTVSAAIKASAVPVFCLRSRNGGGVLTPTGIGQPAPKWLSHHLPFGTTIAPALINGLAIVVLAIVTDYFPRPEAFSRKIDAM